ncbi:MAG: hypothetical protein RLZZ505_2891 [Verrucomicrobiota bacterium]|jgi:hypothetical protein
MFTAWREPKCWLLLSEMKTLPLALLFTLQPLAAQEALSPSDREALLERLEKIREEADSKVDARFHAAISAFRKASDSPNAALDLYLKCEEMVNFDEMKKKNVDFREWKRNNDAKLSDTGFRLALQQQLRWLVLTLEATAEMPDLDKLALDAGKIVETIVSKAEDLSAHRDILQQGVTSSIFARAYDINGLKVENWPLAPAPLAAVYDQVLLPPLRRPGRLESLRAAWTKRMVHEGALLDAWSGNPGEKLKPGVHSPAYDKFVSDTVPQLRWDAEVDLFKAGDEKAAAMRMLQHIDENLSHESAPKWAEDFVTMLQVKDSDEGNP